MSSRDHTAAVVAPGHVLAMRQRLIGVLCVTIALTLSGCAGNVGPGFLLDEIPPGNAAVRVTHIEASVRGMFTSTDARADGTQVTFLNAAALPEMEIDVPSPRDSSKTIHIKIPARR